MEWFQAAVLGLVQGVTEFLPISSSAHLRIVPELFGWADPGAPFTAVTHVGSLGAILLFFAKDIVRIVDAWFRSVGNRDALRGETLVPIDADIPPGRHRRRGWDPADARLGWYVIIATVPIVIVGVLLQDLIEDEFRSLWIVGATFIVLGIVLGIADRTGQRQRVIANLTPLHVIVIGIAQAAAVVPGVSRAGATISIALFLGYQRADAARFALLLAIPTILGAGILEWPDAMSEQSVLGLGPTVLATVLSFLSAYVVVAWLLRWLQSRTYTPFVTYRVVAGLIILGLLGAGVLTP